MVYPAASSFSTVAAFYQAYLVQEKGWGESEYKTAIRESRNGIFILGILSSMIIIVAAAILQRENIEVNAASDLGLALEPLFGRFATVAFMVGFFAASFSSCSLSLYSPTKSASKLFAISAACGRRLRPHAFRRPKYMSGLHWISGSVESLISCIRACAREGASSASLVPHAFITDPYVVMVGFKLSQLGWEESS